MLLGKCGAAESLDDWCFCPGAEAEAATIVRSYDAMVKSAGGVGSRTRVAAIPIGDRSSKRHDHDDSCGDGGKSGSAIGTAAHQADQSGSRLSSKRAELAPNERDEYFGIRNQGQPDTLTLRERSDKGLRDSCGGSSQLTLAYRERSRGGLRVAHVCRLMRSNLLLEKNAERVTEASTRVEVG